MPSVLQSLDEISTGYSIFEKDQVLTHDQLNSVADYADDQIRLTRARLLGVGIVCGLRVSLAGDSVTVTKGIGVTTDGDLIYLDEDTVYDQFKNYDKTFPAYKPLYVGGNIKGSMVTAFEMVAHDVTDSRAQPTSKLSSLNEGSKLSDMCALLLMESYEKDDSLCSGTDCDNIGAEAVNTLKLILIDKSAAGPLRESVKTPAQAFGGLATLIAERPTIGAFGSIDDLAKAYRKACGNINNRLVGALPQIAKAGSAFLADVVGPSSATAWVSKLNEQQTRFSKTADGIQYYYDFLKDLVDTFNEFRDTLFGDTTWCAPPIDGFPKHLLLGDLIPGANLDADRTGFYPSPMTGRSAGALTHAKFLLRKLDALISHFEVPVSSKLDIRVTPSGFENRPLEERAVPFYYAAGGGDPIQKQWSYDLVRRGLESSTYSYNGAKWGGKTAAANPLLYQIGRFHFFRVEGHVGRPVASALSDLDKTIKAFNLPFSVRAVLLRPAKDTTPPTKKWPGPRYTDLHYLHQVIRNDMSLRLQEAENFSTQFRNLVVDAVDKGKVPDPGVDYEGVQVRNVAVTKGPEVATNAVTARNFLTKGYATYAANAPSYQGALKTTVQAAADFMYQASPVVKAEFTSPFDTLISGTQAYWLPWLDQIIQWKDQKEDATLVFSTFIDQHPQAEHFGGVERGGTLVLVHDTNNVVVADFMLPYRWEEAPPAADEPVLTTPDFRPPVIIDNPVRIIPSRITLIESEWNRLKPDLGDINEWKKQVEVEIEDTNKYFHDKLDDHTNIINNEMARQDTSFQKKLDWQASFFKESVDVIKGVALNIPGNVTGGYSDVVLGSMVDEGRELTKKVTTLREQLAKTTDEKMKSFLVKQIADTETALSTSVQQTTQYMSIADLDVTPGSEGFGAAMQVSTGMNALSANEHAHAATVTAVAGVLKGTKNVPFKMVINAAIGQ